jgi:hypothetical protein
MRVCDAQELGKRENRREYRGGPLRSPISVQNRAHSGLRTFLNQGVDFASYSQAATSNGRRAKEIKIRRPLCPV